ncbi:UNVERIFIED_CONTAM: hypothetical protein RMT77_007540 [Armadillidium vulgare]
MFRLQLQDSMMKLKQQQMVWEEKFARNIYIVARLLHLIIKLVVMYYVYQSYREANLEYLIGGRISLLLQFIALGLALIWYKKELNGIVYVEIMVFVCSFLEYVIKSIYIYSLTEEQETLYAHQPNNSNYYEIQSTTSPMDEYSKNPIEAVKYWIMKTLNFIIHFTYFSDGEKSEKNGTFIISQSNFSETVDVFEGLKLNLIFLCLVLPSFICMIIQAIIITILYYHRFISIKVRVMKHAAYMRLMENRASKIGSKSTNFQKWLIRN